MKPMLGWEKGRGPYSEDGGRQPWVQILNLPRMGCDCGQVPWLLYASQFPRL